MVLGCKRIHKPRTLPGFLRIFIEFCGFKVQLAPPHRHFTNGVANPEIDQMLLPFHMYFLLTDFLKETLTLNENSLFNGTYMGRQQPFESFLKNGCSEQLVFSGLMRFYQFEFSLHQIFIFIFLAVDTATGSFRRKCKNLYLPKTRPTLNKHGTSVPLKLFN